MYVHKVQWGPDENERSPVRVNPAVRHAAERVLSLDGGWLFRLDPEERGRAERWYGRPNALPNAVHVPGCWQGQGFGHEGTDTPWDFRLPARVFRATYEGSAWYGKRFRVPALWKGCRIWLNFGGVHPAADIWLNGKWVGTHCGPFVPFAFEVTRRVLFAADNFLAVRVHEQNRWLGLAYNWMGNWSGLYRSVELTATGEAWLDRFWGTPNVDDERFEFRVYVGGRSRSPLSLSVAVGSAHGKPVAETTQTLAGEGVHGFALTISSPRLWSPEEPNLYRVDAVLRRGDEVEDALSERVGFVALATRGKRFLINGQPYYMRGTGDFLANPETGSPDTDRDRWRRKLRTLREYGYNYVRCQSYVPAPEYFDAADEVGLLVQSEMGMLGAWGGMDPWHGYAWPQPTSKFHDALKWQWDRTVMRDVNHPSAAIYCMSNELNRSTLFPQTSWRCYRDTKAIKPTAFVIWTDGGFNPELPGDFVNAEATVDKETSVPVIQHEFRWWSSHPDVRTKDKYRGAVRPYAIETAESAARLHGLHHLLGKMAEASHRLQYVEARGKMEACRRDHPRLAGICHFNAMDIGYSPQGVLDEFCERKMVSAKTWLATNGDTVVMMDHDFDDRVLVAGDVLKCAFLVSDFSHPPLKTPKLEWRLLAKGRPLASGVVWYHHRPFRTCRAGRMNAALPNVTRPVALKLQASLREAERDFRNEWGFWVFPKDPPPARSAAVYGRPQVPWVKGVRAIPRLEPPRKGRRLPKVLLADALDETLVEHCRNGGRVVLAAPEAVVRPFRGKLGLDGAYFFLPPANYPPLEEGHGGTMIGGHPMLGGLPHDGFADLQLYRLIASVPPIDLEALGLGKAAPVIRALSTYFVGLPLAYLMETSVGEGGLILCALNLDQKLPEARYLLAAMLRYAASRSFQPNARLPSAGLKHLLRAH